MHIHCGTCGASNYQELESIIEVEQITQRLLTY
jgi:hypothetical protein